VSTQLKRGVAIDIVDLYETLTISWLWHTRCWFSSLIFLCYMMLCRSVHPERCWE
jgi:hypothetical protein